MNTHQFLAIKALNNMKGDDTYRAQMAFRGMTSEEMRKEHGSSGKTRAEILAEYIAHDEKIDAAIDWVRSAKL